MPSLRSLLPFAVSATLAGAANIILPLYIFPTDADWAPIYDAAGNNTGANFEVVINPASGQPDANTPNFGYGPAVAKLKAHTNIEVLGYIATGYDLNDPSNPNSGIKEDRRLTARHFMDNYATWPVESRPTGIFFDEVTRNDATNRSEYQSLVTYARSKGFTGNVVLNCGNIPVDQGFFDLGTQLVAFEGYYNTGPSAQFDTNWNGPTHRDQEVLGLSQAKSKISIIIHHFPLDSALLKSTAAQLKDYGSIYLTSEGDNPTPYSHFGQNWNEFVTDVATS